MDNNWNSIKIWFIDVDGTLTDGCYEYHDNGSISKRFHTHDMYALYRLKELGFRVIICTACRDDATKWRMSNSKQEIVAGIENKAEYIENLLEYEVLTWENVAYIGDAEGDLESIKKAHFSACPADAIREVREESNMISVANGGHGSVYEIARYFCDKMGISWVEQKKM